MQTTIITKPNDIKQNIESDQEIQTCVRGIFSDIIKYSPAKIIGFLLNLLVVPIYTHMMTPSEYGLYSISIATLSFICIIFSDWVGYSALRFFESNKLKNTVPEYFGCVLTLLAGNLCFMFALTYLFRGTIYNFFHIPPKFLAFIVFLIIPIALRALLLQVLRAQLKPSSYSSSMIVNQILTIVFSVLFIKLFDTAPEGILFAMALIVTIIDIILIHQTELLSNLSFKKIDFKVIGNLCFYGLPLAVGHMSVWIMTQSNKFVLQHYKGSFFNGIAGVAYNLTYSILLSLISIFIMATMPRVIALYEKKIDVRKPISLISGHLIGCTLPIVLFISLYSTELIEVLSNKKYLEATILMPYLAFATLFMLLAEFTTIQYHLVNKTYIDTILKFSVGILGIGLNILLIPKIGIVGVGVAALMINFIYFILSLIIIMPNLNWIVPKRQLVLTFLTSIPTTIMFFVMKAINTPVAIELSTILILYFAIYFLLNKKLDGFKKI